MADETLLNPPNQPTKLRIDDSTLYARIPRINGGGEVIDFITVKVYLPQMPPSQFKTNMINGIKQLCQNKGLIA